MSDYNDADEYLSHPDTNAAMEDADEIERLRAEVAERESDMHLRIRATYDTTVANAWKEKLAEKDQRIDEAERLIGKAIELMSASQVGQWAGVRSWLEGGEG